MTDKSYDAGSPITWVHFYPDGGSITRTGVVWDRGPTVPGTSMAAWVTPDLAIVDDIYCAVLVGRSNGKMVAAHGSYLDDCPDQFVAGRGVAYSSNYPKSPTGAFAAYAENIARMNRAANARVAVAA